MYRVITFIFVLTAFFSASTHADTLRTAWLFYGAQGKEKLERLDPAFAHAEKDIVMLVDLFEPLVYSEAGGLTPGVAKSWAYSSDGKQLQFNLDSEKRWSDGKPVTAQDFVFAYNRLLEPNISKLVLSFLKAAVIGLSSDDKRPLGVEPIDDHTLVIHLTHPYAIDLATFAHPTLFPLPKHAFTGTDLTERWASWEKPLSNGPYALNSIKDGVLRIKSNPYFTTPDDIGIFETVEHYHINWDQTVERFLKNTIDVINRVPPKQYQWINSSKGKKHLASTNLAFLALNPRYPLLQDIRVRKALWLGLDRKSIAKGIDGRYGRPSYGVVPTDYMGYRTAKSLYPPENSFELARALMQEAGYSDSNRLKLTLSTDDLPLYRRIYNAVRSNWVNIYVDLDVQFEESFEKNYEKQLLGNYQVIRRAWNPDFQSPRAYLNSCEGKGELPQCGFFENLKFNALLADATRSTEHKQKLDYFARAEEILISNYTIIPIVHRDFPVVISNNVDISRLEPFSRPRSLLIRSNNNH